MSRTLHLDPTRDLLDPAALVSLAGELDVAGDALRIQAKLGSDQVKRELLPRASACYGAAHLLRRIGGSV